MMIFNTEFHEYIQERIESNSGLMFLDPQIRELESVKLDYYFKLSRILPREYLKQVDKITDANDIVTCIKIEKVYALGFIDGIEFKKHIKPDIAKSESVDELKVEKNDSEKAADTADTNNSTD